MNHNTLQVITTSNPKRFRASKAKATTGCLTCKLRKVKCDEKKPGCARCQNFGFSCGGYLAETLPKPLQKNVDSKPPEFRYIRPRPSQLPSNPSISLPCDETEGRYFRFFQEDALQSVSGYLGSEFWSSIVLQESHNDSSIRHSILAIGALFKSSLSYGFPITGHNIQDEHEKFAVQQYSIAASKLRHQLSQEGQDLTRAVEACLLLTCFEAVQGNVDACLLHIRFGLALLDQVELRRRDGTGGLNQLLNDARIYQIKRTFARIGIQRLCSMVPIDGWDRDILLLSRKHITARLSITNISTFKSISEASENWDVIMSQVTGLYRRALYQSYKNPGSTSSAFTEEHGTLSLALKDWQLAFEPLRCGSRVKPSDAEALVLIRVYNLLAQILLAASIDTSEMRYDDFTENFEEIVMLCQSLAQHHNDLKFSFDAGIIPPLNITASKCRVPRIRDRAISILRTSARREGVFDGILSARVCEWMAAEEMKGYEENQIIPVEARLSIGGFKWNLQERWVWIRCCRPVLVSQGGVTRVEKTLIW